MIENALRPWPRKEWVARLGALLLLGFASPGIAEPIVSVDLVANPVSATYTPGGAKTFEATVSNGASADAVGGLTIRMNLPNGATFGTVSCAVTTEGTGTPVTACGAKAGSGPDWYTAAALAKGGAVKVTFEVNFPATFVGEKTVDVKVSRSAAPVVDATKALDLTSPADPKVEVTKVFVAPAATRCPNSTDDATKYTPGCLARYRVEVTNAGPGHTVGAAFSLGLTEATSNTSIRWACTETGTASCPAGTTYDPRPSWCPASADACGEGAIVNKAVDINGGTSPSSHKLVFAVELVHGSGELASTLGVTASVTEPAPSDTNNTDTGTADNNSASATRDLARKSRITVNKLAKDLSGNTIAAPIDADAPFEYWIDVKNEGPSDLGNGLGETGQTQALWPKLTLSDAFHERVRGVSLAGECAVAGDGLPCWRYCTDTLGASSDTNNNGVVEPGECDGALLSAGRGNLSSGDLRLKAGTGVRLLTRVKAAGLLTQYQLDNTATVNLVGCPTTGAPAGCDVVVLDPVLPITSTASVTVKALTSFQLAVAVSSPNEINPDPPQPGLQRTWSIRVSNTAGVVSTQGSVTSTFPLYNPASGIMPGLIPGSISWQCRAEGNACCNATSGQCGLSGPTAPVQADSLNQTSVQIAPGGSVTYTVTGRIDPRSPHNSNLVLGASAVHSGDISAGPFAGSADLRMQRRARLQIQKKLTASTSQPDGGYLAEYEVRIGNQGPGYAPVRLIDPYTGSSEGVFDWDNASRTCSVEPAPQFEDGVVKSQCQDDSAGLLPGAELVYQIKVPVPADQLPPGGRVVNVARAEGVSLPGETQPDLPGHDITAATVSVTSFLWNDVKLNVTKDDGLQEAYPGTAHQYAISVVNEGKSDAFGVQVRDIVPQMLQDVSWTCSAQSPVPGDLSAIKSVGEVSFQGIVASGDGNHLYAIGNAPAADDSVVGVLQVFHRNPVPGEGYGVVAGPIDSELDGRDDESDSGSTVTGLSNAVDLALSSDGRALYVLSQTGVLLFNRTTNALNPAFGTVSFGGMLALGSTIAQPERLVVSATHVYVSGSGKIAVIRRDATSNQLTLVTSHGAADGVPAGVGPLALSSAGGFLFTASTTSSEVKRFPIRPASDGPNAGRLLASDAQLGGATAGYQEIRDMVLASNGTDLYVLAGNDGTSKPRIGWLRSQGNALSAIATYPDDSDPLTSAIVSASALSNLRHATRITLSPDGEHLIGVSPKRDGTTAESLVFSLRRSPHTGGLSGNASAADDPGFEEVVHQGPSGSLEALLDKSVALAVSSDNRHLFVVSARTEATSAGTVLVFSRRAPDAVLGFVEYDKQGDELPGDTPDTIVNLTAPTDVLAVGNHVYAISLQDSAISLFQRKIATGVVPVPEGEHLIWQRSWRNGEDGITRMARPERMALTPDGRFLFVTSLDNDTLAVFERNPTNGHLSFRGGFKNGADGVSGLLGAAGMAVSDKYLYVAASYDGAIGQFRYNQPTDTWVYAGVLRGGDGVTGLTGIRDLALTGSESGQEQLIGVAATANTVVVFDHNAGTGALAFRQSLSLGASQRPMALAISPDEAHVYVAAQTSSTVHVLERVLDPTSPAAGTLRRIGGVVNGAGVGGGMIWPRDVVVSPEGDKVYVVAQTGNSLLGFVRYDNPGNVNYGQLAPLETRINDVDGVRGIGGPYAVAVSRSDGHIYVAGFDSNAIASFFVGSASSCSAAGIGNIEDTVSIRSGGAVTYVVSSTIRPDATGTLSNTVGVRLPPEPNQTQGADVCEGGGDQRCTDHTELRTSAGLSLTKSNNQATVVPGTWATYDVTVRNDGPSNVMGLDDPSRAAVSDLFDCVFVPEDGGPMPTQDCFVRSSIEWTCSATGSGALDFIGAIEGNQGTPQSPRLSGVSGMALIGSTHLAAASIGDDAVVFFRRDPLTGVLSYEVDSDLVASEVLPLAGARSVAVSADGTRLYVASRVSDSLSVFNLSFHPVTGKISAALSTSVKGHDIYGLDQALHVIVLPSGVAGRDHVYVASANSHAVAAFEYQDGALNHLGTAFNGQAGVNGLADVEYLVASPDGRHVYALSGSGASVALFDRSTSAGPDSGKLSFVSRTTGAQLGVPLEGVSSGSFDAAGKYLYLTASTANRIVVLKRENNPASGSGVFGKLSLSSSIGQAQTGAQAIANPRRALVSPDGQHLYVSSQGSGAVAWFSIHPQTGALGYLGVRNDGSAGISGMAGATGLVFDAQRRQFYVAGTLSRAIVQFSRQSDSWCPPGGTGPLEEVGVDIAAGGQVTFRITAQVSSNHVGNLVNVANVGWISHGTQEGCTSPVDGISNCHETAQDVDVPSINADLSITKDDGLAEYDGLAGVMALAGVDANIYTAAAGDNAVGTFLRVAPDPDADESARRAGLVFVNVMRSGQAGVSGLAGVVDVIATHDGGQVYAASPVDNTIVTFSRGEDGLLTSLDMEQDGVLGVTGLSGARAMALSPDGMHLYAAGNLVNALAIFRRDAEPASGNYGKLDFVASVQNAVGGVSGLTQPVAVVVSPDGKHVYALGSGSVVAFTRNTNSGSANFGRLTFLASYFNGGGIVGLDDVRSLVLGANGAHLYVLGATAGTLVHFARNADSGTLSFVERIAQPELIGAARLRMSPDNRTLYAAGTATNAIVGFVLAEGSGTPKMSSIVRNGDPVVIGTEYPLVGGLSGVADLLLAEGTDNANTYLYASAAVDDALSAFEMVNPTDAPQYLDSMFDGLGGVAPGDTLTYSILVENHGPSDVGMEQTRVVDIFPPEFHSVSWICAALTDGAACQSSAGAGDIDAHVLLPAGGRVRFTATAQVGATAAGRLSNTATITSDGVLDPNLANNSATDNDTVLSPRMDLSIEVDECPSTAPQPCTDPETAVPGGSVAYRVQAFNAGPSYAGGAVVSDALPSALYDVSWTCEATPQAGLLSVIQPPLAVDASWRAMAGDSSGRHLYAVGTNSGAGTVALFVRNAQSGLLTEYATSWREGSPSGTGTVRGIAGAIDAVLSSDGRFLYVAGRDADAVAVFSRDTTTGALTWKAQVRDGELGVDGIGGVTSLAISPDGRHLYAGGASDQAIGVFSINASTGLLTQISVVRQGQNGVNGLNGVADLTFDPAGVTLFAAAGTNRSLTAFRRNVSTGALTHAVSIEEGEPGQPVSLQRPNTLLMAGGSLFVGDAQGNMVSQLHYSDNGSAASFSLVQELPQDAAPQALGYVQDQARLYVAISGGLRLYSLLPEAARLVAGYDTAFSPVLTAPTAMLASPDARHLYFASGSGVGGFLRAYGSRCPLAGEGAIGMRQVDIAPMGSVEFIVQARVFANASGQLVYSAGVDPRVLAYESDISDNRDSDIDLLTPQPDLEVSKTRPDAAPFVVAGEPVSYRIDVFNNGVSDALAALIDDELPVFPDVQGGLVEGSGAWTCAANPPLVEVSRISAMLEPRVADLAALAYSPDGSRLFGVSRIGNALIDMKLAADGSVETVARIVDGDTAGGMAVSGLAGASYLAVSPDGRHLYVTGATSNSVLAFAIEDGGLAFLQKLTSGTNGVAGLQGAAFVLVSGDGRHVYTAAVPSAVNNSAIALFQRDPETGLLAFDERIQDGLGTFQPDSNVIRGVRRLHLTADGSQLYAISTISQSLARFSVDAGTGRLEYRGVMRASGTNAVAALAGVRDFVATPGDTQFYVLGTAGITRFNRVANGSLTVMLPSIPLPGTDAGRSLTLDVFGSRLYLADAAGAIHMYWRNWDDGALELRQSLAPTTPATTEALLHSPARNDVYLATGGADGSLAQFDERAISRCLAATGGDVNFPVTADMGVTGWAAIDYQAMVHPSARGVLSNTAAATPSDGSDPLPGNSSSTDSVPIRVVSDLSISKVGPAGGVAGEELTYEITVNNAGPSDALGIHVRDDLLHPAFLEANWTCVASGDSNCSPSGSGDELDVEGDLLVGDTLKVTLRVRIDPSYIGDIQNTAYVVPETDALDPTDGDHTASPVVTQIERVADLFVSKSNGVAQVVAGMPTSYTITITNNGPSDAPTVHVLDQVPGALRQPNWVCSPAGAAACEDEDGTGSIDQTVSIPAGSSVTYVLNAMLSPEATGQVSNAASAGLIAPGTDPVTANNLSTDTDVILVQSDVSVSTHAPDRYDPQSSVPMELSVDVANLGPSNATGVALVLNFSHAVAHNHPECSPDSGTQFSCTIGIISPNGNRHLVFGLTQLPAVPAVLTYSATVTSGSPDPAPANNTTSGAVEMTSGIDLDIRIDDGRTFIQPGDNTVYTITVRNVGSAGATSARVQAPVALGFLGGDWTCTHSGNAACSPSGTGGIDDTVNIGAGGSLIYRMTVTLDPAIDQDANAYIEQTAEVAAGAGQTEVSLLNNEASDRDDIISVLFKNGFEEMGAPAGGQDEPHAAHSSGLLPSPWWLAPQRGRDTEPAQARTAEDWT